MKLDSLGIDGIGTNVICKKHKIWKHSVYIREREKKMKKFYTEGLRKLGVLTSR